MQNSESYRVIDVMPAEDVAEYTEDENLTDAQRSTAVMLSDLNGEMADGTGTLGIYQLSGGANGPQSLCETLPLDLYDPMALEQYIADKYGPGLYRLHARIKGKKGIAGNKLISIAAPKSTGLVPYNESAKGKSESENNLAVILQQMNAQQMQMMQTLADSLNKPKEKGLLDSLINSLKEMEADKLALVGAGAGFLFKNFFNKKDSLDDLTKILTLTGTIKDLRDENETPKSDDGLMGVASQFLAAFQGMKSGAPVPAQPATRQPAQAKTAPAQVQHSAAEDAQLKNIRFMLNGPFKPFMDNLLENARHSADIEATAEVVLNSVPENAITPFMDFMEREDALSIMAGVQPAVLTYAVWFSELRECMLDMYFDDGQAENTHDVPDPTTGNATGDSVSEPQQQPGGDSGDADPNGEANQGEQN